MLIILNIVLTKLKADVVSTIIIVVIGAVVYMVALIIMRDSFLLEQINAFFNRLDLKNRRDNQ